jgi:FkbM family methyltransferase
MIGFTLRRKSEACADLRTTDTDRLPPPETDRGRKYVSYASLRRYLVAVKKALRYCRELGVPAALSFWLQRARGFEVCEVRVPGVTRPVYCRARGSDFRVLRQVLGRRRIAVPLARSSDLVLDAGANVGYASILFSLLYPAATVVGIEPDRANCEMFRKNCAAYPSVRLLEGAVWPRKTTLSITNPGAASWALEVGEAATPDAGHVRAYTIPEIIDLHGGRRVNLLKLDIEGAEQALFAEGADEWLPRVDVIVVELHDRHVPGCRAAFERALEGTRHTRETHGEYDCARLEQPP